MTYNLLSPTDVIQPGDEFLADGEWWPVVERLDTRVGDGFVVRRAAGWRYVLLNVGDVIMEGDEHFYVGQWRKIAREFCSRPVTKTHDPIRRAAASDGAGWQPISTAPKDGTWVLLASDGGVSIGSWFIEVNAGCDPVANRLYHGEAQALAAVPLVPYAYWRRDSVNEEGDWDRVESPTHWMPLPALPADEGLRGRG